MPTGTTKGIILKTYKEALRLLKDDSGVNPDAAGRLPTVLAQYRLRVYADPQRAFRKWRKVLLDGDPGSMWQAGKARAKEKLQHACAAVGVHYTPSGGDVQGDTPGVTAHSDSTAVANGLEELYGSNGWVRAAVMYALAHASHGFMTALNTTSVEGSQHLADALARPQGTPLITVSNHVAAADDPLVLSTLIPLHLFAQPDALRWTLCATDRCFHHAALVPFFRAAKVLPVERGAGMQQPGLAAAESRLSAGDWVHIFPEGTRSRDGGMGKARKGVGRLVAAAAAAAAAPPLVVPFVHDGMQDVMPRGSVLPRTGRTVRVLVGEPIAVSDLLREAALQGWSDDDLYARIAGRIGARMAALRARLHGSADAGADAAARGWEEERAYCSGLDLYDPVDAAGGAGASSWGGEWGSAGAGGGGLREWLAFQAQHREWSLRAHVSDMASDTVAALGSVLGVSGGGGYSYSRQRSIAMMQLLQARP